MNNVILPELGEGIEKAVVACWNYKVGDVIKKDDDIVEVVTDKATFNIACEVRGVVKEILVKEGHEALIGQPLAIIESDPQES